MPTPSLPFQIGDRVRLIPDPADHSYPANYKPPVGVINIIVHDATDYKGRRRSGSIVTFEADASGPANYTSPFLYPDNELELVSRYTPNYR